MFNKFRSILAITALALTLVGVGAGANASVVSATTSVPSVQLSVNTGIQVASLSRLRVVSGHYGEIKNVNVYSSTKNGCYNTFNSIVRSIQNGGGVIIANTACKNLNPWPWQTDKWHSKISYRNWIK